MLLSTELHHIHKIVSLPIGKRIKKVRLEQELTQQQVAEQVGFSRQALSKIEKGQSESPDPSTLVSLAKVLKNDFGIPELRKYIENEGGEEIVIAGRVSAGKPLIEFNNPDKIFIPAGMVARDADTFAVVINGDSMNDFGIKHRDLVILHKVAENPPNGTVVVVRIGSGDDSEFTIKKWFRDGSKVTLKPENIDYDEIPIETDFTEVHVEGKYAGLIRFGETL